MRVLRNIARWLGLIYCLVGWYACAPAVKQAESDAATCHIHLTNAIHAQATCQARVEAATKVALTDPACVAIGVQPGWKC